MTKDNASERERLAVLIAAEVGWDWPEVAVEGIPSALACATDVADALIDAGFGDVMRAKADALITARYEFAEQHVRVVAMSPTTVDAWLWQRARAYRTEATS